MNATALLELPIGSIKAHPKNVRHAAVADDEMVESIRSQGLLQPLVVVDELEMRDDGVLSETGSYLLIAGHRRLDGLRKAGVTKVPALVRDDLVTEAQQIEAMLVENGRRVDLTPVEESEGYEQLELFGYKPKDIAKATGRSVATVKERLRLKDLSEKAKTQLHDGQISLADAEALMELADDHEDYAAAEAVAGTPDFRYRVREIQNRRASRARIAEQITQLDELGAKKYDERPDFDVTDGPCPLTWLPYSPAREEYEAHAGHLAYVDPGEGTYLLVLCGNPSAHRAAKKEETSEDRAAAEQRQADWEAQIAENSRRREAREAADQVRLEWLTEHLEGLLSRPASKATDRFNDWAHALTPALITDPLCSEVVDYRAFGDALGAAFGPGHDAWLPARTFAHEKSDEITAGPAREAVGYLAAWIAALTHALLGVETEEMAPADALRTLRLWDWIRAAGYQLPEPDLEHVALLEAVIKDEEQD